MTNPAEAMLLCKLHICNNYLDNATAKQIMERDPMFSDALS
jgi:hypothetical protein